MRGAGVVCGLAVLIAAASARAQPGDADAAWELYDAAFERLAAGDVAAAHDALGQLAEGFPAHPAAARARARLDELSDTGEPSGRRERRTKMARAELAFWMTINGVLAGVATCEVIACQGGRDQAAATMLGGGAGLAASLWLSRDGIRPGSALVIDSAVTWGQWNSLAITGGFPEDEDALIALAGGAVGLGGGLLLAEYWRPRAGDVSLANTAGFWTVMLTLLAHGVAEQEPAIETIVLAGDAGLLLGAGLSTRYAVSRGRTLLIDAGGVLGALTGGLVTVAGDLDDDSGAFTPILVGTATGLGLAILLSRDWDASPAPFARVGIAPMGERGWGALASFDLSL